MNELLSDYIFTFLHPWLTNDLLNQRRKQSHGSVRRKSPQLELIARDDDVSTVVPKESEAVDIGVSFNESMAVSWIFTIFQATYVMIGITMGLGTMQWAHQDFSHVVGNVALAFSAYSIFSLLLKVIFFPLFFWLYGRFWINILKIFANMFEKFENEEEIDARCEEIVSNSLTAHTFLVIPIIGDFLEKFSFLVYLYAGLRRNLGLNLFQSILVLLCPLLLILLLLFVMVMSFAMLFATL